MEGALRGSKKIAETGQRLAACTPPCSIAIAVIQTSNDIRNLDGGGRVGRPSSNMEVHMGCDSLERAPGDISYAVCKTCEMSEDSILQFGLGGDLQISKMKIGTMGRDR